MTTTIRGLPKITDDELVELTRLNPGWRFEREDDERLSLSPTHTLGGARSGEAFRQLAAWRTENGVGAKVFASSTGFRMSTGAVRSPDASWLSQPRIDGLSSEERQGFWRACPDVVIEVASMFDSWESVVAKVEMYRKEGATYAVGVDPFSRAVVALGDPPSGLHLNFDAIIDA